MDNDMQKMHGTNLSLFIKGVELDTFCICRLGVHNLYLL
jgi:hypothetical protein